MELRGRNLSSRMRGDDVKRLQASLQKIGVYIHECEGYYGPKTRLAVLEFQRKHNMEQTGVVDASVVKRINQAVLEEAEHLEKENRTFVAHGHVRFVSQVPLVKGNVKVYHKQFRQEILLGNGYTDEQGRYDIQYTTATQEFSHINQVNLLVRAFDAQEALATSEVIYGAQAREELNLVIPDEKYTGKAALEELQEGISGVIGQETVDQLSQEDVLVLAGQIKKSPQDVVGWIASEQLAKKTELPQEVFYAFAQSGMSLNLADILTQKPEQHKKAIEEAVHTHKIPTEIGQKADEWTAQLQKLAIKYTLHNENLEEDSSISRLLTISSAKLSARQKDTFVKTYLAGGEQREALWDELKKSEDFAEEQVVEDLRLTMQISTLTQNHMPMVDTLESKRQEGEYSSLQELAMWEEADWQRIIEAPSINGVSRVPEHILGSNTEEKTWNYIQTMMKVLEIHYPTAAIAKNVRRKNTPLAKDLSTFFAQNPTFDIKETVVDRYVAGIDEQQGFHGLEDVAGTVQHLKSMQRVYRLTDNVQWTDVLLEKGLHSAHSIAQMGQSAFMQEYVSVLGNERAAEKIYARAAHRSATSLMLMSKYAQNFNSVTTSAMFQMTEEHEGIPNWTHLFGSLDLCECEHCRSVYSPAAYLVDILAFLSKRTSASGDGSVLDVLLSRRPDIAQIELSCENTLTPLPYIDLVNEILEDTVSPETAIASKGTFGNAAQLRANPAYMNSGAYDQLATAVYPWHVPFDLWLEESRSYLDHLGVQRHELIRLFNPQDSVTETNVALEYLHISVAEKKLMTGVIESPPRPLWEYWGYLSEQVEHPVDGGTVSWVKALTHVPEFLKRSRLAYTDLLDLLQTEFINAEREVMLEAEGSTCDLEKTTILHVSAEVLDRIQRFVRVQRKTGWELSELDDVLQALGTSELTDAVLVKLSAIKKLQQAWKTSLDHMITWWSEINTIKSSESRATLYESLFLNKAVNNPIDEAFELNSQGDDLQDTTLLMSEHVSAIMAAFQISNMEYTLIVEGEELDEKLNLSNLSHVYRHVHLARTLRLSVEHVLDLKALTGIDPFATAQPNQTIAFIEKWKKLQRHGIDIDQLKYLLRHDSGGQFNENNENIVLSLNRMRAQLDKITDDHELISDPTGEETAHHLAVLLNEDEVDQAVALIQGTTSMTATEQEDFIATHMSSFLDAQEAQEKLVDPGDLVDPEERFNFIIEPLLNYLQRVHSESYVQQELGNVFHLESSMMEGLLKEFVTSPEDESDKAIDVFLDSDFVGSTAEMSANEFAAQFRTFILLEKIGQCFNLFNVSEQELPFLFNTAPNMGWLNWNQLPVREENDPVSFEKWERLGDVLLWRKGLLTGDAKWYELFEWAVMFNPTVEDQGAILHQYIATLSEMTGWNMKDLDYLIGADGFDLTFPADFEHEQWLLHLTDCMTAIRRLGISAHVVKPHVQASITVNEAQSMKQIAKAKYDDSRWLEVVQPIKDDLREKQRIRLVDYVAHTFNLARSEDLYAHFLLDVEMSACQMSSRILQAISSVQLFVQRCFMNLEPEGKLNSDDVKAWAWMKNYRVWEANRKVFLYAENWIEPELRDEKSSFFQDVESELLQGEVTMESAEQAFVHYLEKLDQVARLEICGLYRQYEEGENGEKPIDIMHVFARTPNLPYSYYYRRFVDSSTWTNWEKVDADLQGEHILPVVYNRRLYVFWPTFTDVSQSNSGSSDGTPPSMKTEVGLAWSEYKQGSWSGTVTSERKFVNTSMLNKRLLFFHTRENAQGELVIIAKTFIMNHILYSAPHHTYSTYSLFQFVLSGCHGKMKTEGLHGFNFMSTPYMWHTDIENMKITATTSAQELHLPYSKGLNSSALMKTLGQIPTPYQITYPQQLTSFLSQLPFFYEDEHKTYFVEPSHRQKPIVLVPKPDVPDISLPGGGFIFVDDIHDIFKEQDIIKHIDNFKPIDLDNPLGPLVNPGTQLKENIQLDASLEQSFDFNDRFNYQSDGGHDIGRFTERTESRIMMMTASVSHSMTDGGHDLSYESIPIYDIIETTPSHTNILEYESFYKFKTFYHPYVCDMVKHLHKDGVDGLLQRSVQSVSEEFFNADYKPVHGVVVQPYPKHEVDFSFSGAYASYNWELFFHVPCMIAERLSKNQKFEEAQKWFHYIFNPTDASVEDGPQRFWRMLPFYQESSGRSIQELVHLLSYDGSDPQLLEEKEEMEKQVGAWRQKPFNPHLIARMRLTAYQKNVVMKYIDNLIAWGDQLFRQDTIESINEATQLYILAAEILGKRPETIPSRTQVRAQSFADLQEKLDDFSNAVVEIESYTPESIIYPVGSDDAILTLGTTLYFCIPQNDKLLSYWDTVEDRLFKIRHCMNIEGVVRQLPLFQPPIDPAMLVRAASAGVDIGSALQDMNAPLPHYRFTLIVQKATELCAEVKALGTALLTALEKQDAEEMSLLRAGHEIKVQDAATKLHELKIEEAEESLAGLVKSKEIVEIRHTFYEQKSEELMDSFEQQYKAFADKAQQKREESGSAEQLGQLLSFIPDIQIGTSGISSPVITATLGGSLLSKGFQMYARSLSLTAARYDFASNTSQTTGGFYRRQDDHVLQRDLAEKELEQLEKQIIAAEIRLAMVKEEQKQHKIQLENAKEVERYMKDKYTNKELYGWMSAQISTTYFQSYQLAYDTAKRAEKCYQFELLLDKTFIQFGYWDSMKKGLLAGEKLNHDIKRMEMSYLEQNKREYEITKHISLAMNDPFALLMLKESGECYFELPEALFDRDYPGQYRRRLKSVSITIPCVTGPYTSINCKLTLIRSSVRKESRLISGNYQREGLEDSRFKDYFGTVQSIVTSTAREDSGLFEFNFRDDRYLPFEGAGAISEWRIELPKDSNQFDFNSVSDAIIHVNYTAREGGETVKMAALDEVVKAMPKEDLVRMLSAKHDFSTAWHRFLHPVDEQEGQELSLPIVTNHFPYMFRDKTLEIKKVELFLKLQDQQSYAAGMPLKMSLQPVEGSSAGEIELLSDALLDDMPRGSLAVTPEGPQTWVINVSEAHIAQIPEIYRRTIMVDGVERQRLNVDQIEDLGILLEFDVID